MNPFTNSMKKTAVQASRRFASATVNTPKAPFVPVRAASAKRSIIAGRLEDLK
jgi:hypothetical protein